MPTDPCRCCPQIFYPPATLPDGSPNPLRDPKANMWLTTCGIQTVPQGKCPWLSATRETALSGLLPGRGYISCCLTVDLTGIVATHACTKQHRCHLTCMVPIADMLAALPYRPCASESRGQPCGARH